MKSIGFLSVALAVSVTASFSYATVVATVTGNGTAFNAFNSVSPTVSGTDLINGLSPISANRTSDSSQPVSFTNWTLGVLTDGSMGDDVTDNGSYGKGLGFSNSGFADKSSSYTVTWALDLTASPSGYNLTGVNTYAGWSSDRTMQTVTIRVAAVNSPATFVELGTFTTGTGSGPGKATVIQITDNANPWLATDVAAVQLVLSQNTVFREVDVLGSAVAATPEPATIGLVFMGGLLLLRRRH